MFSARGWSIALFLGSFACSSSSSPSVRSDAGGPDAAADSAAHDATAHEDGPTKADGGGSAHDGAKGADGAPVGDGASDDGSTKSTTAGPCAVDSDCASGLTCIAATDTSSLFGGGPAHGYCSKSCMANADCKGGNGTCKLESAGGPGACVLSCTLGPSLLAFNNPISSSPCVGRDDLACQALDASGKVFGCLPLCAQDSQCPSGLHCDPNTAVCVEKPATGDPTGTACDPTASASTCAGFCLGITGGDDGTISACSSPCVIGGDSPYLSTPSCGGLTKGLCAFVEPEDGAGDLGYCTAACVTQSDCQFPVFSCSPISGLTGVDGGVPNGFCFPTTPCPNGPDDCLGLGGTCTMTASGPLCLSDAADGGASDGAVEDGG
jgi:hypothetical protein